MKRRDFLKVTPAAGLAFMINGIPVSTYADHPLLQMMAKSTAATGRVLVVIQLNGGNDGLNMVIPIDKYSELSNARSNILIPQNKVLALSNTNLTGLHPSMTGIQKMYADGMVNITQGVSYPDPNFSHFRATDIWFSASDSKVYEESGWLGRYLDKRFPGYPKDYPSTDMPDPLAIQIGSGVSMITQGANVNSAMAIANINSFYQIVNNLVDPAPPTHAGHELTFIRYVMQQTQTYNQVIKDAAAKASNASSLYPTNNSLADQLKIVARLIAGGLKTPIYVVSLGGFDTHSAQTDATDTTIGTHATLMQKISEAVYAFFDDAKLLDFHSRVAAMTMSEFGRRIKSNASGGTDHGSAAPVMVFGPGVNPGIIGSNPILPASAGTADNVPMQNDFRGIYAAVLADWFELDINDVNDILMNSFPVLPVFKSAGTSINTQEGGSNEALEQNYPNPFINSTSFRFNSDGGNVRIQIFDANGRLIRTITDQQYSRGQHEITIDRNSMAAGNYFLTLTNNKTKSTRRMTVVD
ncbi:MAG: DUF1501 domain-containing protein [Chitinophagales bacterium]|nr:DUF1501 domain-containing protein [Chitinophagales bacterium]